MDKQGENKYSVKQNENKTINKPDENKATNKPDENKAINKPVQNKTMNEPGENKTTDKPDEKTMNQPVENKTMNKPNENKSMNNKVYKNKSVKHSNEKSVRMADKIGSTSKTEENKGSTLHKHGKNKSMKNQGGNQNVNKQDQTTNLKTNRKMLHSNQISYARILGYISITFELNIALYPAIIDLLKDDQSLHIPEDPYILNWLPFLTSVIGVLMTVATKLHEMRRKQVLYVPLMMSLLGWILLLFGSYTYLITGREIIGFAMGMHSVIIHYCIYECIFVDKHYIRSIALLCKPDDFLWRTAIYTSIGWVGDFVGWQIVIVIGISYHIFALFKMFEVLESPYSFLREKNEPQSRTCFFDELVKVNFSDTISQYAKIKNNIEESRKHEENYNITTICQNYLIGLSKRITAALSVKYENPIPSQEIWNAAVDLVNHPKINTNQKSYKCGQMTTKIALIMLNELSGFIIYYCYLTTIINNKLLIILCTLIFIGLREKIELLCIMVEQFCRTKDTNVNLLLHYSKLFTGMSSLLLGILFFVEQYFDLFVLKLAQLIILEFYFMSYMNGCGAANNIFLSESPYYVNIKLIAPALALKFTVAFLITIFICPTLKALVYFSVFSGLFSIAIFVFDYHLKYMFLVHTFF